MEKAYDKYALIFKAISEETRLKILDILSCGEMCACDILEEFSISQSTLSYHMKILLSSELINVRKDGSWMKYTINEDKAEELTLFLKGIVSEEDDCLCKKYINKSTC